KFVPSDELQRSRVGLVGGIRARDEISVLYGPKVREHLIHRSMLLLHEGGKGEVGGRTRRDVADQRFNPLEPSDDPVCLLLVGAAQVDIFFELRLRSRQFSERVNARSYEIGLVRASVVFAPVAEIVAPLHPENELLENFYFRLQGRAPLEPTVRLEQRNETSRPIDEMVPVDLVIQAAGASGRSLYFHRQDEFVERAQK